MVSRKFDGKTYIWVGTFSTKQLANSFARGLRSEGYSVRTTKARRKTATVFDVWRWRRKK